LGTTFIASYIFLQNKNQKEISNSINEDQTEARSFSGIPDIYDLSEIDLCTKEQGDSYQSEAAYFYNGDFYIYKKFLENKIDDLGSCLDLVYSLSDETKRELEKYHCHDSEEPWSCENELLDGMTYSPYLYKVLLGKLYLVDVKKRSLSDVISLQDYNEINEDKQFLIGKDELGINFSKTGKAIIGLSRSKRYLLYKIGGDAYPTSIRSKEDCNGEVDCLNALNDYEMYVDNNGGNGIFIMDLNTDTIKKIDGITYDYYDPIDVLWLENCDVFEYQNLLYKEVLLYSAEDGKKIYSIESII